FWGSLSGLCMEALPFWRQRDAPPEGSTTRGLFRLGLGARGLVVAGPDGNVGDCWGGEVEAEYEADAEDEDGDEDEDEGVVEIEMEAEVKVEGEIEIEAEVAVVDTGGAMPFGSLRRRFGPHTRLLLTQCSHLSPAVQFRSRGLHSFL